MPTEYEYILIVCPVDIGALAADGEYTVTKMQKLGAEGWELVTMVKTRYRDMPVGVFKRPLVSRPPPPDTAPGAGSTEWAMR